MKAYRVLAVLVLLLTGCGGGRPNPIQGVSPGGIWRGTDSASGLAVTGLVTESGKADLLRADGTQFTGQVSTIDSTLSASGEAFAATTFADGSTHGRWSISGTIQERQSISAALVMTTDNGTSVQGTLDLSFDPLYNRPSSLETVAGGYAPAGGGFELFISDGNLQLSELICEWSGQIAPLDPSYNIYQVHLTTKCDNGSTTEGDGLATLDDTVTPEQLLMGLVGPNGTGVSVWQRQ
jgi:hypothetical protein